MDIRGAIPVGQYIPGESFVHRLDPRVKIITLIVMIAFLFFIKHLFGYLCLTVFIFFVISSSRISLLFVFRSLRPLLILIFITFLFNLFLTPGETIWHWNFLKITKEGLDLSIQMSFRIILLIILSSVLTFTTSPIELTDGIEAILKPLTYFGFPSHELAMMMTIALRFIPTLLEETEKIIKAQSSRGADFDTGSLFNRAKNFVPLFVPLFINTFRRADELALAMESRCYRGGNFRTRMKELRVTFRDYIAIFVIILIVCSLGYSQYARVPAVIYNTLKLK